MQPHELDSNIEAVAQTAHAVCASLRDTDPRELHRELMSVCENEPARMAQVVMALAAWVPMDEALSERHKRVLSVTTERLGIRVIS